MQVVSEPDMGQTFAAMLHLAEREPLIIQQQSQPVAVLMSIKDYERMRHINLDEFQLFREKLGRTAEEKGLTADILENLLDADD
jgi:prevent-host-death family protein